MELIYYDLSHPSCSDQLHVHLRSFRAELAKDVEEFASLTITNGQEISTDAYRFISGLLEPIRYDIDFDAIIDAFWKARKFGDGISKALESKTFVCVTGGKFRKPGGDYHGQTAPNFFAIVVKSYREIVWHEAAHLFGADDHYRRESPAEMEQKCTNKDSCVMRYEPGKIFCSETLREIRSGMSKRPHQPLRL